MSDKELMPPEARQSLQVEEIARYNIRRYMNIAGRSQSELADIWGITRGAVSQRLNGYSQLKFTEVVSAATWLGVTVDDLMDDAAYLQDMELREKMLGYKERTPADVRPRFLVAPVPPVGFEPTTHDLNVSSPLRGNEKSIGMQCAEPSFGPVGECGEAVEKRCECPCVAPDYASRIVSFLVMRYLVMKAVEAAARKR